MCGWCAPASASSAKRLSYAYHYDDRLQGSIHCEILVFERGSWVALPIYRIEEDRHDVCGKTVVSGYIESSSNRRFRVLLSYTKGNSRPAHWMLDHEILCGLYLDGRARPLSEHAIRQGTFENPTDLAATSEASELAALHPHIPREQDQPFCWQARSDKYPQLVNLPKCAGSIDELSSIKLELSRCKLQKVKRGVSVFASSMPRDLSTRADRQFEVLRKKHADLTHEIRVDDTPEDKLSKQELVSDFEYTSDPFVEFKLFYKDGSTLERLGIKPADTRPSRARGATGPSTAVPAIKCEASASTSKPSQPARRARPTVTPLTKPLRKPKAKPPVIRPANPQVTPAKRSVSLSEEKSQRVVSFAATAALREFLPLPGEEAMKADAGRRRARSTAAAIRAALASGASTSSTTPVKRPRMEDVIEGEIREHARPRVRPKVARHLGKLLAPADPETYSSYFPHKLESARPPSSARRMPHSPSFLDNAPRASASSTPIQAPPTPPSMHSDSEDHALPDIDSDNESLPSISELVQSLKSARQGTRPPVSTGRPPLIPGQPRPIPASSKYRAMSGHDFSPSGFSQVTSKDKDRDIGIDRFPVQLVAHPRPTLTPPAFAKRITPEEEDTSAVKTFPAKRLCSPPLGMSNEKKPKILPTPKSINSQCKKPPPRIIDLSLDSESEEEKKVIPVTASTPTAATTAGAGVERNAKARQEAKDFLDSLGILDDMNVEDLLQAGFKSKNTFAPRLKCCAEEDRNALLGDLRQSMGRIDFSILAGFLKGQGIEC